MVFESSGVEGVAGDVISEVAESEGDASEVFEAAVDRLCRCLGYADVGCVCAGGCWFGCGGCRHNISVRFFFSLCWG